MKNLLATIALLLAACGDDLLPDDVAPDAGAVEPDAYHSQPTPAIDWADWGGYCEGGIYGVEGCRSSSGQLGYCVRDREAPTGEPGLYAGECRPPCFTEPPYEDRCPADGEVLDAASFGCTCSERL